MDHVNDPWPDIVNRFGPLVWRTAYRLLNHEADAADCFQDTFLDALKLHETTRVRHWPALLKRLATARALDRLRQRYRTRRRFDDSIDTTGLSRSMHLTDPAGPIQTAELAAQLREALATLPAQQAQAFCLSTFEQLSYREIARQLAIAPGHVGVLLHRARTQLRQLLAEEVEVRP